MRLVRSMFLGLLAIAFLSAPALAQEFYRWSSAPPATCSTTVSGVQVVFSTQPVEWSNLPVGAQFKIVYITNGVETPTGPFAAPVGTGSQVFAAFAASAPAYPASFGLRLETLIGGVRVYLSTLSATCTADGPTTSTVTNLAAPVVEVPTLSALGLALISILLALGGVTALRRQR